MKSLNLLIVDDDTNLVKTLVDGLYKDLRESITATICHDVPSALAALERQTYEMVVSDYNMPGLTGLDLFRTIREYSPTTVLILITAYGTEALEKEAHQVTDAYITKPFDLSVLSQFIRKVIENEQTTQKYRVLILEDDIYLLRLMTKVLKTQNFEIHQATNLKGARERLDTETFDVFISDVQVPDGQSLDLIKEYRETLTRNGTSTILVTGESRYRYLEDELGIDMYLEKPVSINDLTMLVKRFTKRQAGKQP